MSTINLSATILDLFFQQSNLQAKYAQKQDFELYAISSLMIAAKQLEKDDKIPRSGYLVKHLNSNMMRFDHVEGGSSPKIVQCEREILKQINWDFENYPNFYSMIDLFRSQGVLFTQDRIFNPHFQCYDLLSDNTVILVDKYIEFFSLLCLQDSQFLNQNPYLICCAIIAASRKSAGVIPVWPNELSQLSGLLINHFVNIQDLVISLYQTAFKKPQNDSSNDKNQSASTQNNQSVSTADSPLINTSKFLNSSSSAITHKQAFTELQLQKITPDKLACSTTVSGFRTTKAQQLRLKALTQCQSKSQLQINQENEKKRNFNRSSFCGSIPEYPPNQKENMGFSMNSSMAAFTSYKEQKKNKSRPRSSIEYQQFLPQNTGQYHQKKLTDYKSLRMQPQR
ncbi:cyclin-j isoform 1 [Stylonychia lemnae]|uniref:Cyclin-j isoform 1 n=1 Tax=Stylonychia lemnae TaxID=5949 RepID=A0A078A7X1_STYLE|nr:cyclin-j isoform 1 [Stylonychia lemnae]|eukprot:CDW77946.1 cyclin-j isoform 1 [Stylonychia lemnae]